MELQKYYIISLETPKPRIHAYNSNVNPRANKRLFHIYSLLILILGGLALPACSPESSGVLTAAPNTPAADHTIPTGSLQQTAESWQSTLEVDPLDPQASYQTGLILAISSPQEAERYFEIARSSDPSLAPLIARITDALRIGGLSDNPAYRLTLLGQAFGAIGEWTLALNSLEMAAQKDPEYAEAWAYLGEAQQQTGEDGYPALEKALSVNDQSYSANLLMALYLRRNDRPIEALDYLLVAAEQDPNNLMLKEDIANSYAESGQVEAGLDLLQGAVEQYPNQPLAWQTLARLSLNYDIKLEEVGLPAARQAVLLDGDDPIGLLLLGRSYLQNGDIVMAERFLWQASQLDPELADPHYYLGLLYLNQGKQATARHELIQAYQLSPDSSIGNQAMQILVEYFENVP